MRHLLALPITWIVNFLDEIASAALTPLSQWISESPFQICTQFTSTDARWITLWWLDSGQILLSSGKPVFSNLDEFSDIHCTAVDGGQFGVSWGSLGVLQGSLRCRLVDTRGTLGAYCKGHLRVTAGSLVGHMGGMTWVSFWWSQVSHMSERTHFPWHPCFWAWKICADLLIALYPAALPNQNSWISSYKWVSTNCLQ